MATTSSKPENTNTVSGKIVLKETGAGIPNLLVVVYDIDPGAKPEEDFKEAPTDHSQLPKNLASADRIGSVLTDDRGQWSLTYEDVAFRINNATEKRPDLYILVLAPEDGGNPKSPIVLFQNRLLRANSGREEAYMIRLLTEQLIKAEIPVPGLRNPEAEQETVLNLYKAKRIAQRKFKTDIKRINQEFEEEDKPELTDLKKTFKQAILPNADLHRSLYNFVDEDKTIKEVQHTVYDKGSEKINSIIKKTGVPGEQQPVPGNGIKINLILTEAEKAEFAAAGYKFIIDENTPRQKVFYNIPESKIQELLFKREDDNGVNAILFANNPISKYCLEKSFDNQQAELQTGLKPTPAPESPTPSPPVPVPADGISSADIKFYLEKVLASKNSDQFQSNNDYSSQRPNDKSVQANVDSFSLRKGPADTTAFYDFHSLQIAFEHVWHQLVDETLVNLGEKIHTEQENAGRKGFLQSVKEKASQIGAASKPNVWVAVAEEHKSNSSEEVPVVITANFDISFLEFDALTADSKKELEKIATEINEKEALTLQVMGAPRNSNPEANPQVTDHRTAPPSSGSLSGQQITTYLSMLRERGERIIDNIRINKPFSTNQLLKELQERLLSKYEFTVFAADKDYHSVNFGLMNTYRQKWEPISYQAGKLVKTIPLSPKEERKYSVKTTQTVKTTRKQAQKNNSSLQQEINSTSRAESEIMAKAHDKSNFNMSVKLDYSKISSEVSFGKEAEKDSTQTKKDFREAVIKAAQEFKEERSIEIDTEDNYSSEYNESGTIVNPNDELSVTYLFYELQRRYRISEQLYRVMPVVLVAQQVPAPDEITEAWIITHDWILNRALLDDSFRSTLQYLAQKNVGDDFAIRELRKNLRQQRTLVTNLQVEFSRLQTQVDNKYATLQSRVGNRIDEEHDKRFYKWWWWWGQDQDPRQPPDPEMAKAMEAAATDDHKHAVEQAERMALAVQREANTLNQLTTEYNNSMREHLDRTVQCRRLITHIKENILYYMQAIWSMEPPDQRFLRLYKVQVPQFEIERTCIVQDEPVADAFAAFRPADKLRHVAWMQGHVTRNEQDLPDVSYKQLVEVADLDTMLGYKGNYMIFPLKQHNALTQLMAAPYVDEAFGAMDPDQMSNLNLEEFSRYVRFLHDENHAEFTRLQPVLKELLNQLLSDPLRNGDEIIVPTGSMFIEMLPSTHSLLENFKLMHREWDVYKVQAEVRKMELENIRYAARILENQFEDPDVEKQIVVEGNLGTVINP